MYDTTKNKKLLILGATSGEISLVKRAQEFGVKVYVTDNHTDYDLSPAKSMQTLHGMLVGPTLTHWSRCAVKKALMELLLDIVKFE